MRGGSEVSAGHGGQAGFGLVEAVLSIVVLAIGLIAIAGLAGFVTAQTSQARVITEQGFAGQQVMERMVEAGYGSVPTGDTTVSVGSRSYSVGRTVNDLGGGEHELIVVVEGSAGLSPDTFRTRLAERPDLQDWAWP